MQNYEHVRNIILDIVLTLLTCGLYNLYVNHRQILATNSLLKENKYSFWSWFLFSLITCGIYHVYHEYRMSADLVQHIPGTDPSLPLISVILSAFGMSIAADAIQQTHLNRHYGSTQL